MKKSSVIILALLIATSAAIAKTKAKAKPTPKGITYISMHRSACFGRCPDYMIELYSTGMVKYTGFYFVPDSGVYEKKIGKAKIQKIFKDFEANRVDTCMFNYQARIADLPGIFYTIQYGNGKKQRINNAHFGPEYLSELAKEIDQAVKVDSSWKKVKNEPKH